MSGKYYFVKYENGYVLNLNPLESKSKLVYETARIELHIVKEENIKAKSFLDLAFPKKLEVQMEILKALGDLFNFMPNGQDDQGFLPSELYPHHLGKADRLCFFGGSFNPWHLGHSECLIQAAKYEDNLVVVLDYSPWKSNEHNGPIELLVEIIEFVQKVSDKVFIYPGFWGSTNRNPTSKWITKVPNTKSWLMGEDTFLNVLKWNDAEKFICSVDTFYVLPRELDNSKDKNSELMIEKIAAVNKELTVKWLDHHDYEELSSSKMRE